MAAECRREGDATLGRTYGL
ncbi:hypothetical protein E2C01_051925 [Portunus trituberculatus]|uniref:Uncharacterized protein n=1 Tax=Portunus trituberculatus TaxID=210409 RepID=A0A5B7GKC9_PORTR|nr:hypothetical protein [Portunus trituberculatus]